MTQKKDVAAYRVTIDFVQDEAGLFLMSMAGKDQLKITVGGVSLSKPVIETVLLRALSSAVNNHLRLKKKGVNIESKPADRVIQPARGAATFRTNGHTKA